MNEIEFDKWPNASKEFDEEKTNEYKKLTIFDSEYWEMSFNPFCLCNPRLSQTVIEALNNTIDHFGD